MKLLLLQFCVPLLRLEQLVAQSGLDELGFYSHFFLEEKPEINLACSSITA